MFSDNHKISLRQMQALFCFYFLGTASLFLPAELAEGSGRACWLVMLIGGLLAAFFSLVLTYLGKKEPTWTVVEWLRNTFGGVLGSGQFSENSGGGAGVCLVFGQLLCLFAFEV